MSKEHLEHRKTVKAKKPKFVRQDAALPKLAKVWRRPKGLDNKRRLKKDGHQKRPSRGYSSPTTVKGLNPEGLREVIINSISDLAMITEGTIGVIGRTVGDRKRIEILTKAKEQKLQFSNVDIEAFMKAQDEKKKTKEAAKKKKEEEKKKKEAEAKKAEKEAEKKGSESTEEKQKKEAAEKKKVLTAKGAEIQQQ